MSSPSRLEQVRPAAPADLPRLAEALTEAFADDPGFAWCVPDATRRRRYGPPYFGRLLRRAYLPKGHVFVSGSHDAVALWAPPGDWAIAAPAQLTLLPVVAASARGCLARTLRGLAAMEALHREVDEPHYYLALMGTHPATQGQGHGSTLLEHMTARCDREGLPAYLEATTEANRDLYARHGFEVVGEHRWTGGGPPWWAMWRTS